MYMYMILHVDSVTGSCWDWMDPTDSWSDTVSPYIHVPDCLSSVWKLNMQQSFSVFLGCKGGKC